MPQVPDPTAQKTSDWLDDYITKLIDDAPPLTEEQRDKLALLLRNPVRRQS